MKRSTRKMLISALFMSVVLHAAVYLILGRGYRSASPLNTRKGVVSVDFVHSFSHVAPKEKGLGKKAQEEPEKAEDDSAEAVSANVVGQKGVEGDPQAEARETDVFISKITEIIAQHKIYPQEAIDREEEGKVILGLTVERDGRISNVQIEQKSPFDLLNKAAVRSIHKLERFPPVPDLVPVPLHLHVPLVFRLEGH